MKITYDPKYNIGYIQLREKAVNIETIKISDELNIDISTDGKIYGIELLNAKEQLDVLDNGELVFNNELTNQTLTIPIPI
jgi:uncharacterized protein YuzE